MEHNPEFAVNLAEQPVGSTIHVTGGNHFIPWFQEFHDRIGCSNATAKRQSEFTFLNHRQCLFQCLSGGILGAGIFITLVHTRGFLYIG